MSNKVKKTVSLNKTNAGDLKIIKRIEQSGCVFNEFARKAMLEKIEREENAEMKFVQKRTEGGGIKIILG